jgi:hypothetical protein
MGIVPTETPSASDPANERRLRLKDRVAMLSLDLGRTPRREIGNPRWQYRARKLLGCLRRLEQLNREPEAAFIGRWRKQARTEKRVG